MYRRPALKLLIMTLNGPRYMRENMTLNGPRQQTYERTVWDPV